MRLFNGVIATFCEIYSEFILSLYIYPLLTLKTLIFGWFNWKAITAVLSKFKYFSKYIFFQILTFKSNFCHRRCRNVRYYNLKWPNLTQPNCTSNILHRLCHVLYTDIQYTNNSRIDFLRILAPLLRVLIATGARLVPVPIGWVP